MGCLMEHRDDKRLGDYCSFPRILLQRAELFSVLLRTKSESRSCDRGSLSSLSNHVLKFYVICDPLQVFGP